MLRLVRQRWAIGKTSGHWPATPQLGEDAHRYAQRTRLFRLLALLRTLALNFVALRKRFRSIRRLAYWPVAHDISRMLGWVGISLAETDDGFSRPWGIACPGQFRSAVADRRLCTLRQGQMQSIMVPSW